MSVTCRFCHKSLKLVDIAIKQYEARRQIVTCGVVTVEKKGSAVAEILCGGLIVRGKVKGTVKSHGPVLIGPDAEVKGDVSAPSLAVGAGAVLEGQYDIRPREDVLVDAPVAAEARSKPAGKPTAPPPQVGQIRPAVPPMQFGPIQ